MHKEYYYLFTIRNTFTWPSFAHSRGWSKNTKINEDFFFKLKTHPFLWQSSLHVLSAAQSANSSAETLSSEQVQSVLSWLQVPSRRPIEWQVLAQKDAPIWQRDGSKALKSARLENKYELWNVKREVYLLYWMFWAETFSIIFTGTFTLAQYLAAGWAGKLTQGAPEPRLYTDQEQHQGQQHCQLGHDDDGLGAVDYLYLLFPLC